MGEKREVYKVLVGNPEGKRPLERLRRRWMGSDWRLTGGVRWIHLAQDGLAAGSCEYGDGPAGSGTTESVSQLVDVIFCGIISMEYYSQ
jgi:hypothetical protein